MEKEKEKEEDKYEETLACFDRCPLFAIMFYWTKYERLWEIGKGMEGRVDMNNQKTKGHLTEQNLDKLIASFIVNWGIPLQSEYFPTPYFGTLPQGPEDLVLPIGLGIPEQDGAHYLIDWLLSLGEWGVLLLVIVLYQVFIFVSHPRVTECELVVLSFL